MVFHKCVCSFTIYIKPVFTNVIKIFTTHSVVSMPIIWIQLACVQVCLIVCNQVFATSMKSPCPLFTVYICKIFQCCPLHLKSRGGARGRLGGYSPLSDHASPHRKMESDFFGDLWHLSYPENHILAPS